ncbi:hypothetical protein H4Q32_024116 [Labeo rohita]|uniref:Immunoglobulin domain-containing protein n=1 Tax=Labeo rohita TaxID=84645 RepID=A0ABQ8LC34_LABRO|nr:hypothetical protein H4Q32_024116 [Labeo rohita]
MFECVVFLWAVQYRTSQAATTPLLSLKQMVCCRLNLCACAGDQRGSDFTHNIRFNTVLLVYKLSVTEVFTYFKSQYLKMVHLFVLFCLWHLVVVFADTDAVKSVSVKEGDSITLESGLTEMVDDDFILWKFGAENTLIAQINVMANSITVYDEVLDGKFRDRLKMDDQAGSLTITNIRTTDSGVYQLHTSSVRKRFNLTVSDVHGRCCANIEAVIRLVVTALMGVAAVIAVVLLVKDIRS